MPVFVGQGGATTGGHDDVLLHERSAQAVRLAPAETSLALVGEDLGNRAAGIGSDVIVEIDE